MLMQNGLHIPISQQNRIIIYLKIFSGEPGEQIGTLAEKNGGKTLMQEYREIHDTKVRELAA
jgi:hypothetical protein